MSITLDDCIGRYAIEMHSPDDVVKLCEIAEQSGYRMTKVEQGAAYYNLLRTGFTYARPALASDGRFFFANADSKEPYDHLHVKGIDISELTPTHNVSLMEILESG